MAVVSPVSWNDAVPFLLVSFSQFCSLGHRNNFRVLMVVTMSVVRFGCHIARFCHDGMLIGLIGNVSLSAQFTRCM